MRRFRSDVPLKRVKTGRARPRFNAATRRPSAATRAALRVVKPRKQCSAGLRQVGGHKKGVMILVSPSEPYRLSEGCGSGRGAIDEDPWAGRLREIGVAAIAGIATTVAGSGRASLLEPSVPRVPFGENGQAYGHAMAAALKFVRKNAPPRQRIHVCNRNSSRGTDRVDWIGFNKCIQNPRIGRYRH